MAGNGRAVGPIFFGVLIEVEPGRIEDAQIHLAGLRIVDLGNDCRTRFCLVLPIRRTVALVDDDAPDAWCHGEKVLHAHASDGNP